MCELHVAWPIDRITLYVEGGVEPLQVVGQSDFGGVVDEGDELESDFFFKVMNLKVIISAQVMNLKVMKVMYLKVMS
jgi:hypothetical protein